MVQQSPVRIAFAPWMVAGMRTQWENMLPVIRQRSDILAHVVPIDPYEPGGFVERLPYLPATVKGNLRATLCTSALFRLPRLDAVWIGGREMLPFVLSKGHVQQTAIVTTTDATSKQQAQFGAHYAKQASDSWTGRLRDAIDTYAMRHAHALNPWSEWAARSMREDYGIDPHRIHVIPPGINLDLWQPAHRESSRAGPVRLLFVGGDFERKGGDLLLEVFASHLRDRCELHLVTKEDVPQGSGIHVYRDLQPNDPALLALYAHCDIFVLPTRADCFSMASLEAMATGLPVVTTAIGGIPEIVQDGMSGYLVAPDDAALLLRRLDALISSSSLRQVMGQRGRAIIEARFDTIQNTRRLLDLTVRTCAERKYVATHSPVRRRDSSQQTGRR